MEYATSVKTARMLATRESVVGGKLEIGTAGMRQVLASCAVPSGAVVGDILTLEMEDAVAAGRGDAAEARVRTASGAIAVSGLSVGDTASQANIKITDTRIAPGSVIMVKEFTLRHA